MGPAGIAFPVEPSVFSADRTFFALSAHPAVGRNDHNIPAAGAFQFGASVPKGLPSAFGTNFSGDKITSLFRWCQYLTNFDHIYYIYIVKIFFEILVIFENFVSSN